MASPPTFEEVFSLVNLRGLWFRIQNKHYDVFRERTIIQTGADGIDYDHFKRDDGKHLAAIHRKVLSGRYTFAPLLEIEKDKPGSSDKRIISIASIRDTIVQTALYDYFYPLIDPLLTDSVFGYRKGCNAHAAVRRIQNEFARGRQFVFDADFSKFFDSVDHQLMFDRLADIDYDARAGVLFRRFLKTGRVPAGEVRAYREHKGKPRKYETLPREIGLPQGGVLSGLASNLYLSEFDERVRGLRGGYVRYADDFLVCCESPEACSEVHSKAAEYAALLKLGLNESKTRQCVFASDGVEFLGFRISNAHVRVRPKNISRFKTRITGVISGCSPGPSYEVTLRRLARRLRYKIAGPKPEEMRRLLDKRLADHPFRRCWIGFFRIVSDEEQIRRLDRWVRAQVACRIWRAHRVRIKFQDMRLAGLPSLIAAMHRARRKLRPAVK